MIGNEKKKVTSNKSKASNSKEGAKTTVQKAKAARASASGKVTIDTIKKQGFIENAKSKPSEKKYSRQATVLAKAKKLTPTQTKDFSYDSPTMVTKASVKKVDSDAYNLLSKRAKAAGLKGKEAEAAINKAFKAVSSRMTNDRQRTASRGEAIVRREAKKRSGTNLG
jgi:ElaB/YqjD/DUF883 family membrane-anchored ribosome-binding protein